MRPRASIPPPHRAPAGRAPRALGAIRPGARAARAAGASLACLAAACAAPRDAARWERTTLWQGPAAIERVRIGRPDASDPDPQIVGVDRDGQVVLVRARDGAARVLHRHGAPLSEVVIADADPSLAGAEVYAAGSGADGAGGAVVQIAVDGERVTARTVLALDAQVGALEALPPRPGDRGARLLLGTSSGDLHVLACDPEGAWSDRAVFRDRPGADPEASIVADLAPLDDGARAFVVFRAGRALELDLVDPIASRFVHAEPGGFSRCVAGAGGEVYAAGPSGRLLRFARRDGEWTREVLDDAGGRSGAAGMVLGRFPVEGGTVAPLAILVDRAVRAVAGSRERSATLFQDDAQVRALAAGEIVPDNDADELVCAGGTGRLSLLSLR